MDKKAIIEIDLVEECSEKTNDQVAEEIFKSLTEDKTLIPWSKQIKKVVVLDKNEFY
jgi:hypothetical protein